MKAQKCPESEDRLMIIKPYSPEFESEVIALWKICNLVQSQNNPQRDIKRKIKLNPELFLVGLLANKVIATAMGGYDGHRSWINYLAVHPQYQRRGYGRQIMDAIEEKLSATGCPKINLKFAQVIKRQSIFIRESVLI
jgi:ribosomal protein S18 acetylase RimI-like enzyme